MEGHLAVLQKINIKIFGLPWFNSTQNQPFRTATENKPKPSAAAIRLRPAAEKSPLKKAITRHQNGNKANDQAGYRRDSNQIFNRLYSFFYPFLSS